MDRQSINSIKSILSTNNIPTEPVTPTSPKLNANPGGYIMTILPGDFQAISPSLFEERDWRN